MTGRVDCGGAGFRSGIARVLLALCCVSAWGCGSTKPSRFYLLTPVPQGDQKSDSLIRIRLGPLEMPRYLATPEIVTRVSANELEHADYERWAEPLADNFERVLMKNLARMVPTERVTKVPWEAPGGFTHFVSVSVQRFDLEAGQAVLEASWGVSPGPDAIGSLHRSRFVQDVGGDEYSDRVQALSQTLGDLSQEIAAEIRQTGAAATE